MLSKRKQKPSALPKKDEMHDSPYSTPFNLLKINKSSLDQKNYGNWEGVKKKI